MSDTMFTQLTISVQGKKGCGKTELTDKVLKPALEAAGASVTVKDEKGAVYIGVTLPMGALSAEALLARAADAIIGSGVKVVARMPPLLPLNVAILNNLTDLLQERALAQNYAAGTISGVRTFNTLPNFADHETIKASIAASAKEELIKIDAALAALGLRFVEEG